MINGQTAKRADEVTPDHVLIAHFLYVLFVAGSLPVIWIGAWLKFRFVANPWFRYLHLAAILLVVAESLLGIACPLTVWENNLRQIETEAGFIQYWLHLIIFYQVPETVLTAVYIAFAALVAMTFKWVPPRRNNNN
ncbi:DUF2784 domain-containing protein [Nitrosomonas sp. sh817]|uniref:DUF2784 domain-containing protein n=1 Tax=unclassified Nitrosomonas TaxID=2609265 RepID=UPI0027DDC834|nr:DUF2784 domain-containing protein [Nitrosomonas sp. sh817]WMJ08640.1 DUF2784 domain-containing protein [Nitrosomonas sp. sh817]